MPLIIVAGRPCTGKTYFANELMKFLQNKGSKVELFNEETLNISKNEGYKSSAKEKDVRGALKSSVDHNLTPEKFVIIDSLNYIKGYRYELYCTARTVRTTHCVVWVACEESKSKEINMQRISEGVDTYDPTILDELRKRFESPNDNNRWDNPLFKVKMFKPAQKEVTDNDEAKSVFIKAEAEAAAAEASKPKKSSWKPKKKVPASTDAEKSDAATESDNQTVAPSSTLSEDLKALSFSGSMVNTSEDLSSFDEYEACLDKIFDHLSNAAVPLPNISTVVHQHADADLLYELDRTSQKIIQSIVNHQSENIEGTPIKFLEFDRAITLHRQVTLAELQRYKGQYVKINAQHPPNTSKAIGASFIDFLAVQL